MTGSPLKWQGKNHRSGFRSKHRAHQALAVFAAGLGDLGDAVEHQHRRQRQLGVAGAEQLAAAAGQEVFVVKARTPLLHPHPVPGRWFLGSPRRLELLT